MVSSQGFVCNRCVPEDCLWLPLSMIDQTRLLYRLREYADANHVPMLGTLGGVETTKPEFLARMKDPGAEAAATALTTPGKGVAPKVNTFLDASDGGRDENVKRLERARIGLELQRGFRGRAASGQHHVAIGADVQARRQRSQLEPAAEGFSPICAIVIRDLTAPRPLFRGHGPGHHGTADHGLVTLFIEGDGQGAASDRGVDLE